MNQSSRKNEVIHRFPSLAETWMRLADYLERQGQPFLLSFFFTVVLTPFSQLRIVQEHITKFFVFDTLEWYEFATWSFVIFLSLMIYLQKRKRSSLKGLVKIARIFRKLERDEQLIDAAESRAAFELIFADCILCRFGSNSRKRHEFLQSEDFKTLCLSLHTYDKKSKKKRNSKKTPKQFEGP